MSRFVAWLDALDAPLDAAALKLRHAAMLDLLHAVEGRTEAAFSFFLRKRAPVSGLASMLDYQGRWIAETRAGLTTVWAEVAVPVKSLCPCSKEISGGLVLGEAHEFVPFDRLQQFDADRDHRALVEHAPIECRVPPNPSESPR